MLFTLSDRLAAFVEAQVADGRHASASDVVRAGLRLLEEQETRWEALRADLAEGEESGAPEAFDFDRFLRERRMPGVGAC